MTRPMTRPTGPVLVESASAFTFTFTLADKLTLLCEVLGLKDNEFAARVAAQGVPLSKSHFSLLKAGKRSTRNQRLLDAIATVAGVAPGFLAEEGTLFLQLLQRLVVAPRDAPDDLDQDQQAQQAQRDKATEMAEVRAALRLLLFRARLRDLGPETTAIVEAMVTAAGEQLDTFERRHRPGSAPS